MLPACCLFVAWQQHCKAEAYSFKNKVRGFILNLLRGQILLRYILESIYRELRRLTNPLNNLNKGL